MRVLICTKELRPAQKDVRRQNELAEWDKLVRHGLWSAGEFHDHVLRDLQIERINPNDNVHPLDPWTQAFVGKWVRKVAIREQDFRKLL
jgi:hypothetical protein